MSSDLLTERRRNTLALCMCILYLGTKITLLIPFVFILFMDAAVTSLVPSAIMRKPSRSEKDS